MLYMPTVLLKRLQAKHQGRGGLSLMRGLHCTAASLAVSYAPSIVLVGRCLQVQLVCHRREIRFVLSCGFTLSLYLDEQREQRKGPAELLSQVVRVHHVLHSLSSNMGVSHSEYVSLQLFVNRNRFQRKRLLCGSPFCVYFEVPGLFHHRISSRISLSEDLLAAA